MKKNNKNKYLWPIVFAIAFLVLVVTSFTLINQEEINIEPGELLPRNNLKGSADAKVQIVEWSDFECPYCVRFYSGSYQEIIYEYGDNENISFEFKHFPLRIHKEAQKAAEAAECAGEQGKFWEMHDILFEEGVTGGVKSFKNYAKYLGLDTDQFDACLGSGKTASSVKSDLDDGVAKGIRGTPAFLINGQLVSGAQPFSVFEQIIESELSK